MPDENGASSAAERKNAYIQALKEELATAQSNGNAQGVKDVTAELTRAEEAPTKAWESGVTNPSPWTAAQ